MGSAQYYDIIHHPPHYLIMEFIMPAYFDQLERVRYEGTKSTNPLAFRHYNSDELVLAFRVRVFSAKPPLTCHKISKLPFLQPQ